MYALYAVVKAKGAEATVWLGGVDPTVRSGPNFDRPRPSDVNAVGGTSTEA